MVSAAAGGKGGPGAAEPWQFRSNRRSGGVLVPKSLPKSPAEKAGLKTDDVIVKSTSTPIADQRSVTKALFDKKAGDKVKIAYLSNKETKEVEATLEASVPAIAEPA